MKLIKGLTVCFLLLTVIMTVVSTTRGEEASNSAPIINSSMDPLTVSCDYSREDLLKGLTAYDAEDGYITDSIIPGVFTGFKEKGVSEIDYYVYDSDANCGRYKRDIIFSDYSSPEVTLSDPLVFYVKDASDGVVMNRIYGKDRLDGDVKHIKVNSSDIDYETAGDYTISISLINSFGDTADYDLPVHIIRRTAYRGLEIRLNENLICIKSGTEFNPEDFVEEVELYQTEDLVPQEYWVFNMQPNVDTSEVGTFVQEAELDQTEDKTEELVPEEEWVINIQSNVNTSKAGVYEVRYLINKENDADYGNVFGMTWLTVIVVD